MQSIFHPVFFLARNGMVLKEKKKNPPDLRSGFTHNFLWGKDEERHKAWVTATLSVVRNGLLLLDSPNPTVNLP